jgi:mycothiol system anti-sigma-R factor
MSHVDCEQLLKRLWAHLDGEADAALDADLKAHLAECLPCRQHVEFEAKLRQVIQAKCRCERAPAHLRQSVARILGWTLAFAATLLAGWSILSRS